MYLPLLYYIKAVVCRLYEMLYPCICNVVISSWKSGAYDFVICRGGTDMCFVPGSGWKHLDLEQYRIYRDPGFAYVIPVTTQSYGELRVVPTCLSRQGQAQNTLGKHRT